MPPFELHFTDAWLTFLFGIAVLGYGFLFVKISGLLDKIGDMRVDIAIIKTVLRIETNDKNVLPERFRKLVGQ
jgi:hypothetical protein